MMFLVAFEDELVKTSGLWKDWKDLGKRSDSDFGPQSMPKMPKPPAAKAVASRTNPTGWAAESRAYEASRKPKPTDIVQPGMTRAEWSAESKSYAKERASRPVMQAPKSGGPPIHKMPPILAGNKARGWKPIARGR